MRRGVLARRGRWWIGALVLLLLPAAPAGAIRFGAIGDSLTDEYQFPSGLPGANFVEQLVFWRGLDFGSRVLDASIRGEPRNEGFAYNWARFGATANPPTYAEVNLFSELPRLSPMPPLSDQVAGLVSQATSGLVDVVYVGIGANDFFIHLFLDGDFQGPGFESWKNALVSTIYDAVDTLVAAGATKVFVGAIPDALVPNPGVRPPISPAIDPALYAAAVANANQALADAAALRSDVVFVNLFADVIARTDAGGQVTVGSVSFPEDSVGLFRDLLIRPGPGVVHGPCDFSGDLCATEAYARTFYHLDKVHPNSIVQSLMANEFVRALNAELGLGIQPFSDAEILEIAMRSVPVPELGQAAGLLVAALGLAALGRRGHPGAASRARPAPGPPPRA